MQPSKPRFLRDEPAVADASPEQAFSNHLSQEDGVVEAASEPTTEPTPPEPAVATPTVATEPPIVAYTPMPKPAAVPDGLLAGLLKKRADERAGRWRRYAVLIRAAAAGDGASRADVAELDALSKEFGLSAEGIAGDIAALRLHRDAVKALEGLPEAKKQLAAVEQEYETVHAELEAAKSKCLPKLEALQQRINTANAKVTHLDNVVDPRRHDIETRLPHLFAIDPPAPALAGPPFDVSDVVKSRPALPPTAVESPDYSVRWSANIRRMRAAQLTREGFSNDAIDQMLADEELQGMFDAARWHKYITHNMADLEFVTVGTLPQ